MASASPSNPSELIKNINAKLEDLAKQESKEVKEVKELKEEKKESKEEKKESKEEKKAIESKDAKEAKVIPSEPEKKYKFDEIKRRHRLLLDELKDLEAVIKAEDVKVIDNKELDLTIQRLDDAYRNITRELHELKYQMIPENKNDESKRLTRSGKIDYVREDDPIDGQRFCCVSFLSPEGIKNCTLRAVKIRGVFATQDEANDRARKVREKEPWFHVYVGDVGKWLPHDPDPSSGAKSQEYMEEELNDLMKKYLQNREQASSHHEARKQQMLAKHMADERTQQERRRLRAKLEQKKSEKSGKDEKLPESSRMRELEEKERKLQQERTALAQQEAELKRNLQSPAKRDVNDIFNQLKGDEKKDDKKKKRRH